MRWRQKEMEEGKRRLSSGIVANRELEGMYTGKDCSISDNFRLIVRRWNEAHSPDYYADGESYRSFDGYAYKDCMYYSVRVYLRCLSNEGDVDLDKVPKVLVKEIGGTGINEVVCELMGCIR